MKMNIDGESYTSGTCHDHRMEWFSLSNFVGVVNFENTWIREKFDKMSIGRDCNIQNETFLPVSFNPQ